MSNNAITLPEALEFYEVSGGEIGIRAIVHKEYDCAEFVLSGTKPIPILISPWVQFEPKELTELRRNIAKTIAENWNHHYAEIKRYVEQVEAESARCNQAIAILQERTEEWRAALLENKELKRQMAEIVTTSAEGKESE